MSRLRLIACLAGSTFLGACAAPANYDNYLAHMPCSVLVLQPLNQTADAAASDAFISTISRPLAERGYYVYPVAVVEQMMKENGLPTPGEMHQVPLTKIDEVFGADAVLYIVIKEWTTRYIVIDTSTTVTLEYRLVDVRTAVELWHQQITLRDSSSAGAQSPLAMLVGALVAAAAKSASTPEWGLARKANEAMFRDRNRGLLPGPRHPEFSKEPERPRQERGARGGAGVQEN
jgi:hypothetical protein